MARTEPALLRVLGETMELVDDLTTNALRDGVIDAAEQHTINRARSIAAQLEVGNAARLLHQEIDNSWRLEGSPQTMRRIRELRRDLGTDPLEAA